MKMRDRVGKPYQGPDAPSWGFFRVAVPVVGWAVRTIFRVKVAGLDNVPDGPIIISGNHVSYVDGLLLCTLQRKYRHQTHFLIKSEMYEASSFLAWIFHHIGSIPVERGTADRRMIADCEKLLKAGDSLGIFPEGRRVRDKTGGELGEALTGVAFLSIRNNIPIVPVGIVGTSEITAHLPRLPRVFVRIGKPLYPEQFEGARRERMDAMTTAVMAAIAAQMDEAELARTGRLEHKHQAGATVKQKMGEVHANAAGGDEPTTTPDSCASCDDFGAPSVESGQKAPEKDPSA
ncbi:MAG: 1-acyl-sn-glycerol-3-phosphate acyltransferase [Coriobacteriia bacterium]|nr:1-acyl-sn-glycerol-3-phosphate acyltransferase [Coriobacteriia bacterium]